MYEGVQFFFDCSYVSLLFKIYILYLFYATEGEHIHVEIHRPSVRPTEFVSAQKHRHAWEYFKIKF